MNDSPFTIHDFGSVSNAAYGVTADLPRIKSRNIFDKTHYYADGLLAPPLTWLFGVNWKL
jgi:hypothetical protein